MGSDLHRRLIEIAIELKEQSSKVKWTEIVAAVEVFGLNESLRKEAEKIGIEKAARWAAVVAKPNLEFFGDWAEGSIAGLERRQKGLHRIAKSTADIADYEWRISQLNKTIARFIRARDQLVRERDALVTPMEKGNP